MVPFSMLDFTSDFLRLKTRAKSRFLAKTEFSSDFSRLKSRASSRASENCCGGRLFRVHSTLPVGSVQLRVQHFGAEKLDNELNIKWERTFRMTCSKTGNVFLRQRLFILVPENSVLKMYSFLSVVCRVLYALLLVIKHN